MNIFGIGNDIIEIARIKKIKKKYKKKFINKILNKNEFNLYNKSKNKTRFLAKIFSIKESISKALGTGMRKKITFKNFIFLNNKLGKPIIKFKKNAKKYFKKKKIKKIHISFSDEKKYTYSMVILEM